MGRVCEADEREPEVPEEACAGVRGALLTLPLQVWTSLNHGPGSGLDADFLDGLSSETFFEAIRENFTALLEAVAAERSLREAGDARLAQELAETADAIRAELAAEIERFEDLLDAEADARGDADTAEAEARADADATLEAAIDAGLADLRRVIEAVDARLGDEVRHLTQADASEAEARAAADSELDDRLTSEAAERARAVDDLLEKIQDEIGARVAAVAEEAAERAAAIRALEDAIELEKVRRTAGFEHLRTERRGELAELRAGIAGLVANLTDEQLARLSEFATLMNALSRESASRAAAVSAESAARDAAVAALLTAGETEKATRIATDTSLEARTAALEDVLGDGHVRFARATIEGEVSAPFIRAQDVEVTRSLGIRKAPSDHAIDAAGDARIAGVLRGGRGAGTLRIDSGLVNLVADGSMEVGSFFCEPTTAAVSCAFESAESRHASRSLRLAWAPGTYTQFGQATAVLGPPFSPAAAGGPLTWSFWAKATMETSNIAAYATGDCNLGSTTLALTETWTRFTVTGMSEDETCANQRLYLDASGTIPDLLVWIDGFQVEEGSATTGFRPRELWTDLLTERGGNLGVGTDAPLAPLDLARADEGLLVRLGVRGNDAMQIRTGQGLLALDVKNGRNLALGASGGNVGIGTATPAAPLHVDRPGEGEAIRISTGGSTALQIATEATPPRLVVSTSNLRDLVLAPAGNVIIGSVQAAAAKLHVAGDVRADGAFRSVAPGADAPALLDLARPDNGPFVRFAIGGNDLLTMEGDAVNNVAKVRTLNGRDLALLPSGNVGIGTEDPAAAVHVDRATEGEFLRLSLLGNAALQIASASSPPSTVIATSNARHMVLLPAGNLGIGTTSPAASVHADRPFDGEHLRLSVGGNTALWMSSEPFPARATIGTANGRHLILASAGNVGIGTASPADRLDVNGGVTVRRSLTALESVGIGGPALPGYGRLQVFGGDVRVTGTTAQIAADTSASGDTLGQLGILQFRRAADGGNEFHVFTAAGGVWGERLSVANGGKVGIGTKAPAAMLHVDAPVDGEFARFTIGGNTALYLTTSQEPYRTTLATANGRHLVLAPEGNLGVGVTSPASKLDVAGDGRFSGQLYVHGSTPIGDVAEPVTSAEVLEPGDVVVADGFDAAGKLRVRRADAERMRDVVGVVSTNPSLRLAGLATDVPLAVTGIVPVKVIGPIEKGDLLTTSAVPGHAEACRSSEACFGAVIGKALEGDPAEGPGEVRAIISLG